MSGSHSPGSHPEIAWGSPPAVGHHSRALHWNRVPCEDSRWCIGRLPGEDRGEAGLCVVSTVVQLCHGQDSEGSEVGQSAKVLAVRLEKAGKVYHMWRRKVFRSRNLGKATRMRSFRTMVMSVLLYGAETWPVCVCVCVCMCYLFYVHGNLYSIPLAMWQPGLQGLCERGCGPCLSQSVCVCVPVPFATPAYVCKHIQ